MNHEKYSPFVVTLTANLSDNLVNVIKNRTMLILGHLVCDFPRVFLISLF